MPPEAQQQIKNRTLLSLGLNMLANSGPSLTPTSLGQVIGQSGIQALSAGDQLRKRALEGALLRRKMAQAGSDKFARTLGTEDIVDPGPDKKYGTDDDFVRKVGVQATGRGQYETFDLGRAPKTTPEREIDLYRIREEIKTSQTGQRELNKAMAGQFAEGQERQGAKERVTNVLGEATRLYDELDRIGAAVDAEGSSYKNIINRIGSSDLGQSVGKLLGTQAQSIRNQINQLRPTLLNEIRQATEMGARGLDSERELQFYMEAVADPGRDIQSNKAALQTLSEAYGLGLDLDIPEDKKEVLKAEWDARKGSFDTTEGEIGFDDQGSLRFTPGGRQQAGGFKVLRVRDQ